MNEFKNNDIDFDEASKLWKQNKKYIGNGCYIYICMAITVKNKPCLNKPLKNGNFCHIHKKKNLY
tara:strand:+ start:199 stop:393 length:195 start_codon:yes stop_codon:yes gene_type:complete